MSRGNGFKRPALVRTPPSRPMPIARGVVVPCSEMGRASPKENVLVSQAYQNAVRSLPCMRCGRPPRSQFCHTDEGKGAGIKTDDRRGWAGCAACHYLVGTSGTFTKLVRRAEDDRLAAKTRAEVLRRGIWPRSVPKWEDDATAKNSGATP